MVLFDVIEHPNEQPGEIVRRFPEHGSGEFRLGSQLIVREGQRAVFFRDGKALDVFGPGRHTLSTNNIPLLTALIGIPFGGQSPFTAEVYFVSMREFTDMKWGSPQPMVYRDTELGMVRLRAFGTYSMRVADPQLFVNQVVGTQGAYTTAQIDAYLKSVVISEFTDVLGHAQTSILDLAQMTRELADTTRNALADDFERLGLQLTTFQVGAITPPEEVQRRIDERSGMAALGDMATYTQFQAAQAMREAAQNPSGGAAGTGVGLGAGIGLGQAMAEAFRTAGQSGQAAGQTGQGVTPAPAGAATVVCPHCGATIPANAKFCPECGKPVASASKVCPRCGTENPANAKFCTNCGTQLT
jgi:membrane protease subunit (stomatin/prohibitin family)